MEWYGGEKYFQTKIKVESITLKDFMKEKRIKKIDMMWLDAQGSELMILKGMGKRLKDVRIILTEVELQEEYAGQPLWPDMKRFFEDNGFTFWGWAALGEPYNGDTIFINNNDFNNHPAPQS